MILRIAEAIRETKAAGKFLFTCQFRSQGSDLALEGTVFNLIFVAKFFLGSNPCSPFFDTFAIIHATTSGGPADATSILVYKVYSTGFVGQDYGSSAAQSVILMGIVIVMTFIQFRYIERKVQY